MNIKENDDLPVAKSLELSSARPKKSPVSQSHREKPTDNKSVNHTDKGSEMAANPAKSSKKPSQASSRKKNEPS